MTWPNIDDPIMLTLPALSSQQLDYTPSNNWHANNCEFYIDAITGQIYSHGSAYRHSLDFSIWIDLESLVYKQHGEVLAVAICFFEQERPVVTLGIDNKIHVVISESLAYPPGGSSSLTAGFAFFLDIRRSSGLIERLWLTNGAKSFDIESDLTQFRSIESSHGVHTNYTVLETSPLFHQKKACPRQEAHHSRAISGSE
jgi:hypothetical protein